MHSTLCTVVLLVASADFVSSHFTLQISTWQGRSTQKAHINTSADTHDPVRDRKCPFSDLNGVTLEYCNPVWHDKMRHGVPYRPTWVCHRPRVPPNTCLDTEDKSGRLCYPKCPNDGHNWVGRGPWCWSDTDSFPYFTVVTRGYGHVLRCASDLESLGAWEMWNCYLPCPAGFNSIGSTCVAVGGETTFSVS